MDIEAIRKKYSQKMIGGVDFERTKEEAMALLSYIAELEEKLRWKNIGEEKPPLCKEILLKNSIGRDVQTLYAETDGRLYFLYRGKKIYPQPETTQWREIE